MSNIVTIDGPAGVGKSTLAKRVAEHRGVPYLDTGAMFRTLARGLGREGLTLPEAELRRNLEQLRFALSGSGADTVLICNGSPSGDEIRTEEVGLLASSFAALGPVRDRLKACQQALGADHDLVAEGRDMGTVVFPGARWKFFLDASPETRALRRQRQLAEKGLHEDLATLTEQIRLRDTQDRERAIAPLRPAPDARIIDTSTMDIDQVFSAIVTCLT